MIEFCLPEGTIIKHGTSLDKVENILKEGILPGSQRNDARTEHERAPEIAGVYIGKLIPYFGAYAAYSSILYKSVFNLPEFAEVIELIVKKEIKKINKIRLPKIPITLPVVLTVKLKEDTLIFADEDYVYDGTVPADEKISDYVLTSEAKSVWEKWQSACIKNGRGLPPDWIESIEYPRLSSFHGGCNMHKDTVDDCELFACGLLQSFHKMQPTVILEKYYKRHGRESLSQKTSATNEGLSKILSMKGISDLPSLYINYAFLTLNFENMAAEYNIPLHRC